MSLGKTVRRRRQALDLTLEELAERAELTPNYLGSIERERRDPSLSSVEAIARALGTTAGELLGGVKGLGPEGLEIAGLAEKLSVEQRAAVMALLKTMVRRR